MAFFEWNENLSVGILQLDTQHKTLVNMINNLYEAMSMGKGKDTLPKIIKEMSAYAVSHFSSEEKLMQMYEYPEYESHKKEHELFVKKIQEFKTEINKGNITITLNIANFLKSWLVNHIQGTDKKYSPFLEKEV
ncbi:MAG: bacteriohemerythrin [Candidatus Hydrogenedentes bacterium]|nr:bacteriohemerythrin [Candidatus Hydrogenedentota bacterium]